MRFGESDLQPLYDKLAAHVPPLKVVELRVPDQEPPAGFADDNEIGVRGTARFRAIAAANEDQKATLEIRVVVLDGTHDATVSPLLPPDKVDEWLQSIGVEPSAAPAATNVAEPKKPTHRKRAAKEPASPKPKKKTKKEKK